MDHVRTTQAVLPGPGADGGARGVERRIVVDKDNVRHFLSLLFLRWASLVVTLTHCLSVSLSLSLLSSPRPDTRRLTGAANEPTALTERWETSDDRMGIPDTRYHI